MYQIFGIGRTGRRLPFATAFDAGIALLYYRSAMNVYLDALIEDPAGDRVEIRDLRRRTIGAC